MSEEKPASTPKPPKGQPPVKPKPSMTANPKLIGRSIIGGGAPKDS